MINVKGFSQKVKLEYCILLNVACSVILLQIRILISCHLSNAQYQTQSNTNTTASQLPTIAKC